jgi:hypothetical protein
MRDVLAGVLSALRMCCQRRVAAGTRWRMRDLQRRKFRSSSWPRQYRLVQLPKQATLLSVGCVSFRAC